MSVPVNQRKTGTLAVCTKAHEMCVYTIKITANTKTFKPEYNSFTARITDSAIVVHTYVWMANNIRVTDKVTFSERYRLQTESLSMCYALLSYIDIAKNLFHLDTKRVKYWAGLVIDTKNLIRAWRESDKERNAEYR